MSNYLGNEGVDIATTRTAYQELGQLSSKYGELAVDGTLAAAGALPPPFGTAADLASLGKSLFTGDWGGALMDTIGLVPIFGDAAKAGKIANKLNDLRRAIDVATTGMQRVFAKTNDAAKKFWDDAIKANKGAYEEALSKCNGTRACREAAAAKKGPQYAKTPKSGDNGTWTSGERGDGVWTPSNGGPAIRYENGFPQYGDHAVVSVDIPMRGTDADFTTARNATTDQLKEKLGPNWRQELAENYTWHHKENGTTMELIPRSVHATGGGASTPHMGGASLYNGGNAAEF